MRHSAMQRSPAHHPAQAVLALLHALARALAATAVLAALAIALLIAALQRGPVEVSGLARMAEAAFVDETSNVRLVIGGARLSLAGSRSRPALRFTDVRLQDAESGETIVAVPRLGALFSGSALLEGRLAPVAVRVMAPTARIVRERDGRFRADLGLGGAGATAIPPPGTAEAEGFEAIGRLIDALAGEGAMPRGIDRLRRVEVREADLFFRNAATGTLWRTDGASLTLSRGPRGLSASATVPVTQPGGETVTIRATGARGRGADDTILGLEVDGLRLDGLGREIGEVAWLAPVEAPLSGRIDARLRADGNLDDIEARLSASAGRFRGRMRQIPFAALDAHLAYDADTDRLHLDRLSIEGEALTADFSGSVTLEREGVTGGAASVSGVNADLVLGRARLDMPGLLGAPATFDRGRLALRARLNPARVEIDDLSLARGDLRLSAHADLRLGAEGAIGGTLHAVGQGVRVADVKALWPAGAGDNARDWVRENLVSGRIPTLRAEARLGEDEALALDFTFEEAVSRVLDTFPPIEGGAGRAALTLDEFALTLDEGSTEADGAGRLSLAGSSIRISDFSGDTTPADIALTAEGPLAGVLAVIDREPLRLVQKLGLDLGPVAGRARVAARLDFPLLADLPIERVRAEVEADLTSVALEVPLGEGEPLAVASDALSLVADTEALRLRGRVSAAEATATLDWRERYGPGPGGRRVALSGRAGAGTLDRLGLGAAPIAGGFGLEATLTQEGSAPMRLDLGADMTEATIEPPGLDWSKPAGTPGRLVVAASLGESVTLERLEVEGGGFVARGSGRIGPQGPEWLRLDRLSIDERAQLSVEARAVGGAGFDVTVGGERLDLALFDASATENTGADGDGSTMPPPFGAAFRIAHLTVAPGVVVTPSSGTLSRAPDGRVEARFEGRVNGFASGSGTVRLPAGRGDGRLTLDTTDAGAFLRATGLATEARGGTLALDARLVGGSTETIEGMVRMADVRLTEGSVFQRILRQGGDSRIIEGISGGLGFNEVEIPFRFEDGMLRLDEAVATGGKLAVTLDGTIDMDAETLALRGVASPAYALSGFLDDIPVLGRLLTGRRGEGILALTFRVGGTIDDPRIDVNPLSLLAPGILRTLLTGGGEDTPTQTGKSDAGEAETRRRETQRQRFRDQLGPPD